MKLLSHIIIQSSAEVIYTYCMQFIWFLFYLFFKKNHPLLGIWFSRDYIILTVFIVCLNGVLIMFSQIAHPVTLLGSFILHSVQPCGSQQSSIECKMGCGRAGQTSCVMVCLIFWERIAALICK